MRPQIQALADRLLDRLADAQEFDVIKSVAHPLPSWVICQMLSIPFEDDARLSGWTAAITRVQGSAETVRYKELIPAAHCAAAEFMAYVRNLISERRNRLSEDLLSALILAEEGGDQLSLEELVAVVMFLFNAGHHTTRDFMGNALLALLQHRDQWDLLVADPSLLPAAVEECLRYDPSITNTVRFALQDTQIDGTMIHEGEMVTCQLNAANRDPEQFSEPDRFDIRRTNKGHLAFGGGLHFCLGATLARLEAQIVLGSLARRYPGLQLAAEKIEWRDSATYRGPVTLPVTVT
jgi:cytochrome P450